MILKIDITQNPILTAFDKAGDYDVYAWWQRDVAMEISQFAGEILNPKAQDILDLGCGTGFVYEAVCPQTPKANWLLTDFSPAMCARAAAKFKDVSVLTCDGQNLPFAADSFDVIFSSMVFQWFDHPFNSVQRIKPALKKDGQLIFAIPLQSSFEIWRNMAQDLGLSLPFRPLPDLEEWLPICSNYRIFSTTKTFKNGANFMKELKKMGAGFSDESLSIPRLRQLLKSFDASDKTVNYDVLIGEIKR